MSDHNTKATRSSKEPLTQSLRHTIEQMAVPEIIALIEFAERVRQEKQKAAQDALVAEFRERAATLGLSPDSFFAQPARRTAPAGAKGSRAKLPPKYRSPDGEEWTGRGRTPSWLAALEAGGRARDEFKV